MKSKSGAFTCCLKQKEIKLQRRATKLHSAKPFTNGEYIKEAFLSLQVLFDGLPNKDTIISKIKDMHVSDRTVERHVTKMFVNVKEQQTLALRYT